MLVTFRGTLLFKFMIRRFTQAELSAHHEAGHGVVAYFCRRELRRIRIDGQGAGSTHCTELTPAARSVLSDGAWRQCAQEEVYICLAGPLAEQRLAGSADFEAGKTDLQMARTWIRAMDEPTSTYAASVWVTRSLIGEQEIWTAVCELAEHLVENRFASGRYISALCQSHGVPRIRRGLI